MRRLLVSLLLTSVLILPVSTVQAQRQRARANKPVAAAAASQKGAEQITVAQMREYLTYIASDEMEGRDTPSRGLDLTAKFLAMNLANWGLKPAGDDGTYFQKIALRRDQVNKEQTRVRLNDQELAFGEDYIALPIKSEVSGPLVFAGNGWFIKSKNIDAYKGIDAKGKIAVIFTSLSGLPRGVSAADLSSGKPGEDWMDPNQYARKQGAVATVIVPDFQFLANWERNRQRINERPATVVDKFQPSGDARCRQ